MNNHNNKIKKKYLFIENKFIYYFVLFFAT